jgi:hypothetical protein
MDNIFSSINNRSLIKQEGSGMKITGVACGLLCIFLAAASSLHALDDQSPAGDEKNKRDDSTAGIRKDSIPGSYGGDSWIDGALTDDSAHQNADILEGFSTLHVPSGSYSLVPSPSWYSNQYGGSALDTFRLADRLWLINRIHYAYYNTTRDKNFPDRLQKVGDNVMLRGEWFTAGAAVSSKSDILFQSFKSVNINAGANFRVWRSGPHSILVGFIFSSRAEYWRSAFPLPTFAYRYMTPRFMISVGIPLYMVWRPNDHIDVIITGMLPGVGSAQVRFKLHLYVSLSLSWVRRIEPFYLSGYPFRDLRYVKYRAQEILNYRDEIDENKKFILSTNRAGVTLAFNVEGYVTISVFNGIQFASTYYLTKNIMDLRPDREYIRGAYVFEASARGFLYSLRDSE